MVEVQLLLIEQEVLGNPAPEVSLIMGSDADDPWLVAAVPPDLAPS